MQSLEHRISPFFWFGYYLNKYVHHFHRKFRGLGTAIRQMCRVYLHVQEVILTESDYFEETRKHTKTHRMISLSAQRNRLVKFWIFYSKFLCWFKYLSLKVIKLTVKRSKQVLLTRDPNTRYINPRWWTVIVGKINKSVLSPWPVLTKFCNVMRVGPVGAYWRHLTIKIKWSVRAAMRPVVKLFWPLVMPPL